MFFKNLFLNAAPVTEAVETVVETVAETTEVLAESAFSFNPANFICFAEFLMEFLKLMECRYDIFFIGQIFCSFAQM